MSKKKQPTLTDKLKQLENLAYCSRNMHRAWKMFESIKAVLPDEQVKELYRRLLDMDPDYPDSNVYRRVEDCRRFSDYIKKLCEEKE